MKEEYFTEMDCPIHGKFLQSSKSYCKSHTCAKCFYERNSKEQAKSQDDFIKDAIKIHGNLYEYHEANYINGKIKVHIKCKKHGLFAQTPNSHLSGNGCPRCAELRVGDTKRQSLEGFIAKAQSVHEDKYDYSLVDYKRSHDKVKIRCEQHGVFEQSPANHLSGKGCRGCMRNGFNTAKAGKFYVLVSNEYIKIGITNRKVEDRLKSIVKDSNIQFKEYLSLNFEIGKQASELESHILSYLRSNYESPKEIFDGSTECFLNVDLNYLLSKIQQFKPT